MTDPRTADAPGHRLSEYSRRVLLRVIAAHADGEDEAVARELNALSEDEAAEICHLLNTLTGRMVPRELDLAGRMVGREIAAGASQVWTMLMRRYAVRSASKPGFGPPLRDKAVDLVRLATAAAVAKAGPKPPKADG